MTITAKDGKECNSVQECLAYEAELDRKADEARHQRESRNIVAYIVNKYKDSDDGVCEDGREAIFVHTLSNHRMVADNIAHSLFGQQFDFIDNIPIGANAYRRYQVRKVTNSKEVSFCKEELANKRAIVVELNDVPKVFSPKDCRYFAPCVGGQASFRREYAEDEERSCTEQTNNESENSGTPNGDSTEECKNKDSLLVWRLDEKGVYRKYEVTDENDLRLSDLPVELVGDMDGKSFTEAHPLVRLATLGTLLGLM